MPSKQPKIAIVGAGMGGLAAAAILRERGIDVQIYEQAERFARIGAGIQMAPNPMKVLRGLGLEPLLRQTAFQHRARLHRDHDTGRVESEHDMLGVEKEFGAPHLMMHRGDLHSALLSRLPEGIVNLNKKLRGFEQDADGVTLTFIDGTTVRADALIGADGVHSVVRGQILSDGSPTYTDRIAYRSTFPAHLMNGVEIGDVSTKWWGGDRHIVIYYITAKRDEIYFTTSIPSAQPDRESWTLKGDMGELRAAFADFHPTVRAVLNACPEAYKWPIFDREPQTRWGEGRVYLLGDAVHPMTPYMAQGAAQAIEDAAILGRCLEGVEVGGLERALKKRYEATRLPRASMIQSLSHLNKREWMRTDVAQPDAPKKEKGEPGWVYGYDAWTTPLAEV